MNTYSIKLMCLLYGIFKYISQTIFSYLFIESMFHHIYHTSANMLLLFQISALFSVNNISSISPSPKPKSGLRVLSLFDGISTGKTDNMSQCVNILLNKIHFYKMG